MSLPPVPLDLTRYLASGIGERQGVGAAAVPRRALTALCRLGGVGTQPYFSGLPGSPPPPSKQPAGSYAGRPRRTRASRFGAWPESWNSPATITRTALMTTDESSRSAPRSKLASSPCSALTTSASAARTRAPASISLPTCFYLSQRKSRQYRGSFLDVARPAGPSVRVAHNLLVLGKCLFKAAFVIPCIVSTGRLVFDKPMPNLRLALNSRSALVYTGMASERAGQYADRSMRAGCVTSATAHGLSSYM